MSNLQTVLDLEPGKTFTIKTDSNQNEHTWFRTTDGVVNTYGDPWSLEEFAWVNHDYVTLTLV